MAQQGIHLGLATTEGAEQLHGLPGAALLQDVLQEGVAGLRIEDPLLLEAGEGIGGEHLGPLVAVVARRIAPCEDVGEAVLEAVERRRRHHRHLAAHLAQQRRDLVRVGRVKLLVQAEVEQGELQLAQHLHRRLEVAGRHHLLQQIRRQRLPGLVMAGDKGQRLGLPAPVFQELARQLHRIPGHAVDAGHAGHVDPGQHVVNAMAELVEQGDHLVVGEQGRLAIHRAVEVAGQVGHRLLQRPVLTVATAEADIHPGAALLVLAGIEIEVEAATQLVIGVEDVVEAYVRVPGVDTEALAHLHAEHPLDHLEQSFHHPAGGEVGAQLLVGDGEFVLLELLGVIGEIPGRQFALAVLLGGEGADLVELRLALRQGFGRQIREEVHHLLGLVRHLGGQRQLGVVGKAQQPGQLVAQGEQLGHDGGVVPLARVRPLIRGAGGEGLVQLGPQGAIVGVHHHRQVGGDVQSEQPPLLALELGHLAGGGLRTLRQTCQLGLVGHQLAPALGRVQHVVAEAGGELGEAGLDFAVALLRLGGQTDAGEAEVTQGVLDLLALGIVQAREVIALEQRQIGLVKPLVLADIGLEFGEQRQAGVMSRAQRLAVLHGVEVADGGPDPRQAVVDLLQRRDQAVPGMGLLLGQHILNLLFAIGDGLRHGRLYLIGLDLAEGRQRVHCQQRVSHLRYL